MTNEPAGEAEVRAGDQDGGSPSGQGDRALPPRQTALLGSALVVVWAVLLVTLFALWPLVQPEPAGAPRSLSFPGFGPAQWHLTPDVALILLVVVVSALGSFVHAATSFSTYVGNRRLCSSWVWWYLLRVAIGASLALLVYFVIRGGFFSNDASSSALNPYGIAAVAGLSGLFSKQATDKLREVFDTVLSTGHGSGDAERADKVVNPQPVLERVLPDGCLVRNTPLQVTLEGRGFVRETTVHVRQVADGGGVTTLDPVFVDGTHVQVVLPAGVLGEAGGLALVAENPQPGGGRSEARPFTISDPSTDGDRDGSGQAMTSDLTSQRA
ncbi:MAG: hypothetical protein ACLGIA_09135 [Actinomycetes bacterium]